MAQLTGFAGAYPHGTSDAVATSTKSIKVGTRARDVDGNEYVYVDFTGTVYAGTPVAITASYEAAKVGTTGRGAFGVAVCGATSDESGWVQIYGRTYVQLLHDTAGVSPSDAANAPTTLATTAQTKFWLPTTATSTGPEGLRWTSGNLSTTSGFYIQGLTVANDSSGYGVNLIPGTSSTSVSNVSPYTTHTGSDIAVWLNYPQIVHVNWGE